MKHIIPGSLVLMLFLLITHRVDEVVADRNETSGPVLISHYSQVSRSGGGASETADSGRSNNGGLSLWTQSSDASIKSLKSVLKSSRKQSNDKLDTHVYPAFYSGYSTIDKSQLDNTHGSIDRYNPRPYFDYNQLPIKKINGNPDSYLSAKPAGQDTNYQGDDGTISYTPPPGYQQAKPAQEDDGGVVSGFQQDDDEGTISYTPPPGYRPMEEKQPDDYYKPDDQSKPMVYDSYQPIPAGDPNGYKYDLMSNHGAGQTDQQPIPAGPVDPPADDYDFTDHGAKPVVPPLRGYHKPSHHDVYHEIKHHHVEPPSHHEVYHEVEHPPDQEQRVDKRPYSYYFLGRKLWYIPLYFSVYFIGYIFALVVKSIARHKINLPQQLDWAGGHARGREFHDNDKTALVSDAIRKYSM